MVLDTGQRDCFNGNAMGTARGEFVDRLPEAVETRFTWRYRSHYLRARAFRGTRSNSVIRTYLRYLVGFSSTKRIENASAVRYGTRQVYRRSTGWFG